MTKKTATKQVGAEKTPADQVDPVGLLEIAERLGRARQTIRQLHVDGRMPVAPWTVSGMPAWDWHADIEPWARETGRLPAGPT
jgi:hypothetical protein